ncbi:monovalent cation/H(+) antiporter subunit G [Streptomyces sp. NPDC085481]|uniref:monovalent cation/H(+) antiporter subunit G n=1 Tax=Streptomyces sp. NPDC085481 TaxID=3365727 RepID=UPI0037CD8E85
MAARTICATVLLVAGVGVLLLAVLALRVLPGPYARLHALSAATSLGAPLVVLALAVDEGPGRRAAALVVTAVIIGVGGTLTTLALGRSTAQYEGRVPREDPP